MSIAAPAPTTQIIKEPTGFAVYDVNGNIVQRRVNTCLGADIFGDYNGTIFFVALVKNVVHVLGSVPGFSLYAKDAIPSVSGVALKASGGDANILFQINGSRPIGNSVLVPDDGAYHTFSFESVEGIPENSFVSAFTDTLGDLSFKFV
jgi:hypothetical protein